jgi:hypothetical protein
VEWISQARDVDITLAWMKSSLGTGGIIATTNPALLYLKTGRKSIGCDHPTAEWHTWKGRGVRYVAVLFPLALPTAHRDDFKVLYQSPAKKLWVIEI